MVVHRGLMVESGWYRKLPACPLSCLIDDWFTGKDCLNWYG